MKNNLIYFSAFIGLFSLYSCETEIEPNAEYKDVAVVYGLLNPNDTNHYIKITKAFSGKGNANDLAANASNFNYADGELEVKIDEYNASDVFVKSFVLARTVNEIPKDNGIFSNTTNVLYKFTEANLKSDFIYKLNIRNKALDKDITSETKIANNPIMPNVQDINTGRIKLANTNGTSLTHIFAIKPSLNSGRVKVNFIFSYGEHYTDTAIAPVTKQVKISLGEQKTTSNEGGDVLFYSLEGANFFSALRAAIPASVPNLKSRRINNGILEVIVAGTDLSTYIAVNEPSNSVNQNKPEFSNLTNALGVFSSRNTKLFKPQSPQSVYGFDLDGRVNYDDNTLKVLLAMGLEFCNPRNDAPGLPFAPPSPRCEVQITNWSTFNP
jgi:hypothetical protein